MLRNEASFLSVTLPHIRAAVFKKYFRCCRIYEGGFSAFCAGFLISNWPNLHELSMSYMGKLHQLDFF